ncbi:siderophore-interacting protein [Kushneria sp. EE4]
MPATTPYQLFDMTLTRREQISPSMVNLTFTANDLDMATTFAPDQRVKLFFPASDQGCADMAARFATEQDWYSAYKNMAPEQRPFMRTYTIRAVRPEKKELDIEFVLHGDTGPASRWASRARPGDTLSINAPSIHYTGKAIGCEWRPPASIEHLLLVADETALPAVMGIIEELDARFANVPKPRVQALLEVPLKADCRCIPQWIDAVWLPREETRCCHGEGLSRAVRTLALKPSSSPSATSSALAIDIDEEILWDVSAPESDDSFYAWIASESRVCLNIRRYLVDELAVPKRQVSAMGYWREGKAHP